MSLIAYDLDWSVHIYRVDEDASGQSPPAAVPSEEGFAAGDELTRATEEAVRRENDLSVAK